LVNIKEEAPHTARLPLEGVRVLDFTIVWAGPMCTRILADLGAEVIKVEATVRYDPERGPARGRRIRGREPGERPYNRVPRFNEYNRNKLGITVNLKHPSGPPLIRELVRKTDVVVENFSAGVLERLGFGYEELRSLRPDIILLSMQGFGSTGPESANVAYGPTQEAMSGFSLLTGYEGGPPLLTGTLYGDPVGGTFGAATALMALWRKRHTGEGGHYDLSQQEALLSLIPEVVMEYERAGRALGRRGNRDEFVVQGCYRCLGDDDWITIAVENDEDWQRLCSVMGREDLVADERFTSQAARLLNQDAIDATVSEWTLHEEHYDLMHRLQRAGVAALAVLNAGEVNRDRHFRERAFFQELDHPEVGVQPHSSSPWRFGDAFLPIRRPAPTLGEHNHAVLGGLLGLSDEDLELLASDGVIGDRPLAG
jgi:crotonobetainyl-CoA:carnitine CoA-transferase CaiB-like acyl-CoA transferase